MPKLKKIECHCGLVIHGHTDKQLEWLLKVHQLAKHGI